VPPVTTATRDMIIPPNTLLALPPECRGTASLRLD
jgi:hypothetical protein